MIVHVTLAYRAEVLAPRQRNAKERTFSASLTVEVAETTLADLPVAFRWKDRDLYDVPSRVREVRWDGEHLWQPSGIERRATSAGSQTPPVRDAAWLLSRSDAHDIPEQRKDLDPLSVRGTGARGGRERFPGVDEDPTVNRIRSSRREERIAEVEEAASRLLLVDGMLYVRAPEPVYHLRWDNGDGWKMRVEVVQPEFDPDKPLAGLDHWRLDEIEHMADANELAKGSRHRFVEVLIPEAVRAPLPETALVTAGTQAMADMESHLKDRDAAFFASYAALRDEVRPVSAALAAGEPVEGAGLAAALTDALPQVVSLRRANDPEFQTMAEQHVEQALRRYDAHCLMNAAEVFAP